MTTEKHRDLWLQIANGFEAEPDEPFLFGFCSALHTIAPAQSKNRNDWVHSVFGSGTNWEQDWEDDQDPYRLSCNDRLNRQWTAYLFSLMTKEEFEDMIGITYEELGVSL